MITLLVGVVAAAAILTGAVRLLKYWKQEKGTHCQCRNRVRGKVVIVTGANSGIGYETSVILAKRERLNNKFITEFWRGPPRGWIKPFCCILQLGSFIVVASGQLCSGAAVYLACRNVEAGTTAVQRIRKLSHNRHVYCLPLDLNSFNSVKQFVLEFISYEKRLDALIHNAAVFHHPSVLSADGFDVTLQTNYLGPVLLTELLKPALRSSGSSRVVFLSSEAHRWVKPEDVFLCDPRSTKDLQSFMSFVLHYGISKLALKFYAIHCAQVFIDCDVDVTSVDPGNVWTPIYRNCWREWRQIYTRLKCRILMRTPYDGAQSVIHALSVPNIISGYIKDCKEVEWDNKYVDMSGELDSFITRSLVWTKLR